MNLGSWRIPSKRRKYHRLALAAFAFILCDVSFAASPWNPELDWRRQFGTGNVDQSESISADGLGNAYVTGGTNGNLVPGSGGGNGDGFVSKYNSNGARLWTRVVGGGGSELSYGVSADVLGNVFVAGYTNDTLGSSSSGALDAYVRKFNAAGNVQWTRQLGTSGEDWGRAISADGLGNAYLAGHTNGSLQGSNLGGDDAFISKLDAAGNIVWTRQFGTTIRDQGLGVSVGGSGSVFVTGFTWGDLGGPAAGNPDAFLTKFDTSGNLQWSRQLGTSADDYGVSVAADGFGNAFIGGYTTGSLAATHAGNRDAFLAKYDVLGNLLWTRQLGSASRDEITSVTSDQHGNVFVSGLTGGSFDGPNAGDVDLFVAKYDAMGDLVWLRQRGTNRGDIGSGVSVDTLGNLFFSGSSLGNFAGVNSGDWDVVVGKYLVVPEASGLTMAIAAGLSLCANLRRARSRRAEAMQDGV